MNSPGFWVEFLDEDGSIAVGLHWAALRSSMAVKGRIGSHGGAYR